jgi:hypothetical protein
LSDTVALGSVAFTGAGYQVIGLPINAAAITQTAAGTNSIAGIAVSASISQVPVTISGGGILNVRVGRRHLQPRQDRRRQARPAKANTNFTSATAIGGGALIVSGSASSAQPHGRRAGWQRHGRPVTTGRNAPGGATPGL